MQAGRTPRINAAPFAAVLLLAAGLAGGARSAPAVLAGDSVGVSRDVIVLLDITGSMRGLGTDQTARNIWGQVVEKLVQQVNDLPDGSSLTIVPFDAGPRLARIWPNAQKSQTAQLQLATLDQASRAAAIRHIRNLVPDGGTTGICDSLEYALTQMRGWRTLQTNDQRVETVFIYTDGLDNGKCKDNFVKRLVSDFQGATNENPFLYGVYIDLNGRLRPADRRSLTSAGFSINTNLPDFIDVDPGPTDLSAALLDPKGTDLVLHLTGKALSRNLTARVDLLSGSAGLTITPAVITLASEVTIRLTPTRAIAPGAHAGALVLTPIAGNFQFTNSTTEFLYQAPVATPSPTADPTAAPTTAPTVTPVAPPVADPPAPSPAPLFLIPIMLLMLATAVVVAAELYRRTPRFAPDAVLELGDRVVQLRAAAGFAFMRPQRVLVSGGDAQYFRQTHGAGPQGCSPTTLTAIKGSCDAWFDPAGTTVTANDGRVTGSMQIAYGTRLHGASWESRLLHGTRLSGGGWAAVYRSIVDQPAAVAEDLAADPAAEAAPPPAPVEEAPPEPDEQDEPVEPVEPPEPVEEAPPEPDEASPDASAVASAVASVDARLRALEQMQLSDQLAGRSEDS